MNSVLKLVGYLRWHLIAIRYMSMLSNWRGNIFSPPKAVKLDTSREINKEGYADGPTFSRETIEEIRRIYDPRIASVVVKETGAPFTNLVREEDINAANPVMKIAFSKEILDAAIDYFGGKVSLDSIQVLYSWPTHGQLRESQKWHKDYGDSKSFHAIVYLNDVTDFTHGPFVFLNKKDSRKMKWSPFVRRVSDQDLLKEMGKDGEVRYFYGKAGATVLVDPAKCYHYGSRCETPRMAIFATFNSTTPFVAAADLITENAQKLVNVAAEIRPDLPVSTLEMLIGKK